MEKNSHHSMKWSLAFSFAAHIIFLILGMMHFIHSPSLPSHQLEAVPITLTPLSQELSLQQGSLNAPPGESPALNPTTKLQEKEQARHVGDGEMDLAAPFKKQEKLRQIDAASPIFGEKDAAELPVLPQKTQEESVQPERLQPEPKPTQSEQIQPEPTQSELAQPEPAPAIIPPPLTPVPETVPLPRIKAKASPKRPQQTAQASPPKGEQTIEDILALEKNDLINRARTQGGGAKRSQQPEAIGAKKDINASERMAQTLVNLVGACIQSKLKLVAIGGNLQNRPIVRLQFQLDNNGMIQGTPIIDPLQGDENQKTVMTRQIYAAVFACQPYADLPRDQYNLWGQGFDFNVDPLQGQEP
ncbi:hypothetical protein [Bartonella bacilliformis]|uniref:Protein TolA n=1 Tax=Bartonella bacilliformis Ver097 TaxID=1293911 RepID=A0A072R6M1_BARBA|nr:hypothetical protein [Bartonella bacilliformis]KEG21400.1 hypothetical protein H710_00349 [Bartonella bacilliformis Ver097]